MAGDALGIETINQLTLPHLPQQMPDIAELNVRIDGSGSVSLPAGFSVVVLVTARCSSRDTGRLPGSAAAGNGGGLQVRCRRRGARIGRKPKTMGHRESKIQIAPFQREGEQAQVPRSEPLSAPTPAFSVAPCSKP
jgi:hypothetical protein